MGQVCHEHCPASGHGALVVVVAGGAAAAVIGSYIGEILLVAGSLVSILVVVGVWYLVHVLRRDRFVTHRAEIASQADVAELRLVSVGDASAPAMDGHYQRAIAQHRGRLPAAEAPVAQAVRKAP